MTIKYELFKKNIDYARYNSKKWIKSIKIIINEKRNIIVMILIDDETMNVSTD